MNSKQWLFALAAALAASAAGAQTAINQAAALAGGVTPGDAPGFPVTIGVPGSYRLTGNLKAPGGGATQLIVVNADDVTIDLNGYTVYGPTLCAASTPYGNACTVGTAPELIRYNTVRGVLRNGNVEGGEGDGIRIETQQRGHSGFVLEDLFVSNNAGYGVRSLVPGITVRNVSAALNAAGGLLLTTDNLIDRVRTAYNNGTGLSAGARTVATQIVTTNNSGTGTVVSSGTIVGMATDNNGGDGYSGNAAVTQARARNNDGDGFRGPVMLTQSVATINDGNGYSAPPAGGCYGNLYSGFNGGTNIAAAAGFVGTLTVCP